YHLEAGIAHQVPGVIVVAHDRVDGALAPPSDAEAPDALREGRHALLRREEIAVVELQAVYPILLPQPAYRIDRSLRLFGKPPPGVILGHGAEGAGEWAADARMVRRGLIPQD